ncbi:MAG TPA: T9SS type A sorting domain-containing protein, partial [Ignavibacteriaceae bacterium]|nr:T9SS type A sorting domain-containing protein [Ignavibacteriaceae bacterium]
TDSYTPTGDTITDDYITPNIYDIWKTTVSPGTVTLGDNNGVFESSMYFVFYRYYESPLPVELSAFEAIVNNNSILLKWETKTEINNYGFELQRTTADNKTWDKIAFIPGSGNSSSTKSYSYLDKNLSGNEFLYRIKQIDSDGSFSYSVELKVELFPLEFEVLQNYPNPFNPKTKIKFSVKNEGMISVKVYDNLGKEIKVLLNEYKAPGFYTLEFDGSGLSSGIYFLKFQEGNLFQTKKLVLMK